jgi:hypothetical protein
VVLSKTTAIARGGRYRLAVVVAVLALLGVVVSHHNLTPEDAHGMEMGAICLAVLAGGLGLARRSGHLLQRPRPAGDLRPATVVLSGPLASALPRAGPQLRTVVLRC